MSRETSTVTTFRCNSCGKSQTIGGDFPETVMDEHGWSLNEKILGNAVDLCHECTAELKDFINWEDPATSLSMVCESCRNSQNGKPWTGCTCSDKVISEDFIPCCCAGINPADGEEICEPCANNNHEGCVGPL